TRQPPCVRVLTYHRFGSSIRDPFSVREDDFERQMSWLAREGLAISLADLEGFLAGRQMLASGAILVTIDDGAPSAYTRALPILRRHGIPAVLFVPAGEIHAGASADSHDEGPEARMTRAQLVEMARSGVTIGSHAWTHHSLGHMSLTAAREQATRSRATLEDLLGTAVTSFAYPFGTRADYSDATAELLREAGYTSAFTSQHGAISAHDDALALPRVKVEGGEGMWMFQALTRGGLDGWRWIDRTLWKMQAAEA
ncbi:MAG: polysaccharide deacetylase family protein, partial [Candidatus Binatia bacterium]